MVSFGPMARWLLLVCLLLSACGGGSSSEPPAPPPPPPVCCASLAAIDAEFGAAQTQRIAEYDTRRENAENARAGNGTFFNGAHLEEIRDMAIVFAAPDWCDDARAIVDSYSDEGISPDTADLVEDYRASLMGYVLDDYDAFTAQYFSDKPALVAQVRQEIVDGMNAQFDQLQVDLQGYY